MSSGAGESKTKFGKIDAKILKRDFYWHLYCRFPGVFSSPHREDPAYWEARDLEENIATRVPLDEELSVGAVCGVEVYGPAEIDALYKGLEKLGWDKRRTTWVGAVQWLRDQRTYGGAGGNFNVGLVTRREDKRFLLRDYFAPMPDEVDYLTAEIFQISESLTCVVISFAMREHERFWYKDVLSRNRRMIVAPDRGRRIVRYLTAGHLKKDAVKEVRDKYRSIAADWFKQHLPGFFSSLSGGVKMPTSEIIITSKYRFFEENREIGRRPFSGWNRLIYGEYVRDVWTCTSCTGLQAAMNSFDGGGRYHSIFSLRHADLSDEDLRHLGGREFAAYLYYCEERIRPLIAYYAAFALLEEAMASIKLAREQLKADRGDEEPLLVLEGIRKFISAVVGVPAVARELVNIAENGESYRFHCADYSVRPFGEKEDVSVIDWLRKITKSAANKLITEEAVCREQFEQLSSVLSTRESVKAQKRMEFLTVVALVVALASLFAALPPVEEWRLKIETIIALIDKK